MAPNDTATPFGHYVLDMGVMETNSMSSASQREEAEGESGDTVLGWLQHEIFRKDCLDRRLKRHHITGIGFSGAVGIGLFVSSGENIATAGPAGAFIAFCFAGLIVFSVMRCLAEMVSVRPMKGALIDFPSVFVDEALGFAVGISYWLANCMSMVALIVTASMLTQYWESSLPIGWACLIILTTIFMLNVCGVRLYGNLEWMFKWLKIMLLVALCILMIAVKAGVGPGKTITGKWIRRRTRTLLISIVDWDIAPGWNSTGFFAQPDSEDISIHIDIPGTWGKILAIWTCTTVAMFQFMGGDIVLVTAGEAESPRRDLPTAARYMYLLPVGFYMISILLVGLNIDYTDPLLYHDHVQAGYVTGADSPFVIAIEHAGLRVLPGFLNSCFIFSALTAANSALYVTSRTLFVLSRSSRYSVIRNTLARTNNGNTPIAAIVINFVPGLLAFLCVKAGRPSFDEPIRVFGRFYTGSMLCIYGSECLAFLRFMGGMKQYRGVINRDGEYYKQNHYRAHWQPLWAIIGLFACSLLMIFSGWSAIYNLCSQSEIISTGSSIVDLIAAYLGPAMFFCIYFGYKALYGTRIRSYSEFKDKWFPRDIPDEPETEVSFERKKTTYSIRGFLSWVK